MGITYKIHPGDGFVEVTIDSPPSIDEYQQTLPEVLRKSTNFSLRNWLISVNLATEDAGGWTPNFTAFVCNELKYQIDRICVVCDFSLRPLMIDLLSPIENHGKPIGVFDSRESALDWISKQR